MDTTRHKLTIGRPVLLFATGLVVGGLAWTYLRPQALYPPPAFVAFYDEQTTAGLGQVPGTTQARFYFAANAPGDKRAVVAPADVNGRHVPEGGSTKFRLYRSLSSSRATVDLLDETHAEALVKQSRYGTSGPWSIDCPMPTLLRMLDVPQCNGVGVAVQTLTDGSYTFQLIPVQLANGKATVVGASGDAVTGMPCPTFCAYPQEFYLHRRP